MIIGASYGLHLIGLSAINPLNTGWQFNEHDSAAHFIGWEFFRHETWSFPPGVIRSYLYPQGTSIVFTDSIPIAAFIFKPLHAFLPVEFQYFGLWRLLNYAMQGLFGYLLIFRVTQHAWSGLIGSLLFCIAPILTIRMGHAALQSHWLILYALYLYLRHNAKAHHQWAILLTLSALIHFYLFTMVFAIWCAYLSREGLRLPPTERRSLMMSSSAILVIIALLMWWAGYFVTGSNAAPPLQSYGAYGQSSMDLIAPLNPVYAKSGLHIPPLPTLYRGQWNGFCYLGAGAFLLVITCLLSFSRSTFYLLKNELPLVVACLLLSCFAISNVVTLAGRVIFEIPLPPLVQQPLGVLRASGRFIWPVIYALLVGACATIAKKHSRMATFTTIILAATIQVIDLWPQHWQRSQLFSETSEHCRSPLNQSDWQKFARRYQHIAFIPPEIGWRNDRCDDYVPFASFAAKNNMTLNVGYAARVSDRTDYTTSLQKQFATGELPTNTIYVLKDWAKETGYATKSYPVTQEPHDDFTIIAPGIPISSTR